jgi:hypothetical protein
MLSSGVVAAAIRSMQISGEGKIGVVVSLVATGGGAAILAAPRLAEIGWVAVAAAAGGAVSLIRRHFRVTRQ